MGRFPCRYMVVLLAAAAAIIGPATARADQFSMQIGTAGNEPAWMVSLDGVAWYTPFQAVAPTGVSAIGVQRNLKGAQSTFPYDPEPAIGGLDLTDWNGMWAAKYSFYIPAWAKDIHLHLNDLSVDDKAGIFVDGFPVGFFALNDLTGPGTFQFADFPNNVYDVNYISSQNFPKWGWDKELMPGWNAIEVYLNNTDDPNKNLAALSQTNVYGTKLYTFLSMDATVTYTPEPQAWILLVTIGGLIAHRIRRRR